MSTHEATVEKFDKVAASADSGRSLWQDALKRLKRDKFAVLCFWIIVVYVVMAFLCMIGVLAPNMEQAIGESYQPPSFESIRHILGTDIFGRSVWDKAIFGTKTAITVGLFSCLIAIPIGVSLGAVAGYFGGWVDYCHGAFCRCAAISYCRGKNAHLRSHSGIVKDT